MSKGSRYRTYFSDQGRETYDRAFQKGANDAVLEDRAEGGDTIGAQAVDNQAGSLVQRIHTPEGR